MKLAKARPRRIVEERLDMTSLEPSTQDWVKVKPADRLRRCQAMRRLLKDPIAAHDERTFPKL